MNWTLWILLFVVLISGFLYWNSRPIARSKDEVIKIIDAWLKGTIEYGEWDYFESCKIKDKELEAIRLRCVELSISPEFTVEPRIGAALNERGKKEVREILLALQSNENVI